MKTCTRYVVTCVAPLFNDGTRELWDAMQGRYTFATPEEAQARIDAAIANNAPYVMEAFGPLEVRPCECYSGHFDPVGRYFNA